MTDPFDTCLQLGQSQRVEVSLSDQRGGVLAPAGDTLSRLVAVHEVCLDAAPAERPTVAHMAARLGLTPRQLLYQFSKAAGEPLALWTRKWRGAAWLRQPLPLFARLQGRDGFVPVRHSRGRRGAAHSHKTAWE